MSDTKENTGQAPAQEVEKTGPSIDMDITVRPIEPKGNLLGFASVKFGGGVTVDDFKIVEGKDGLFVGMPSKPDQPSKNGYRNTVRIDPDFRETFNGAVLKQYALAVEQTRNRAANLRDVSEKPGIEARMKEAQKQADRDNAARPTPAKADKGKMSGRLRAKLARSERSVLQCIKDRNAHRGAACRPVMYFAPVCFL